MKIWCLLWLYLLALPESQFYENDPQYLNCFPEKVTYEWERNNFYELLGFSSGPNSSLTTQDIRKAYRSQGKIWHPDKRKADDTTTIEEINARFALISQAYETLSSPQKRQQYDQFLEQCKFRGDNGQKERKYQKHQQYSPYYDPYDYHKYEQKQRHSQYHQYSQQQYHQRGYYQGYYDDKYDGAQNPPSNVRRSQEMLMEPVTGAPILRETIFEEYKDQNYYRILVEDFLVQNMDAWGNSYYQPLYSTPLVVEEGELFRPPMNALYVGDYLRTGERLISSSGQYRARILNCQLVIERNASPNSDKLVWKSGNYAPFSIGMDAECFLALEGNQLYLAGGSPEFYSGEVHWRSSVEGAEHHFLTIDPFQTYLARLDDDGTLAVYMVDVPFILTVGEDLIDHQCIFSTSPAGCSPLGRKLIHLFKSTKQTLGKFIASIKNMQSNENATNEKESSDESSEYSEGESFDRLMCTLNRARRKASRRLSQQSLKLVRFVQQRWKTRKHRKKND